MWSPPFLAGSLSIDSHPRIKLQLLIILHTIPHLATADFPGGSDGKVSAYNVGDPGSIPGPGRSPGEGNGNPLQYSCLENPMDRGARQATFHGVAKSRTRLSGFTHSLKHESHGCFCLSALSSLAVCIFQSITVWAINMYEDFIIQYLVILNVLRRVVSLNSWLCPTVCWNHYICNFI